MVGRCSPASQLSASTRSNIYHRRLEYVLYGLPLVCAFLSMLSISGKRPFLQPVASGKCLNTSCDAGRLCSGPAAGTVRLRRGDNLNVRLHRRLGSGRGGAKRHAGAKTRGLDTELTALRVRSVCVFVWVESSRRVDCNQFCDGQVLNHPRGLLYCSKSREQG